MKSSLFPFALLLIGAIGASAENVEFPIYTSWAKCPVGTTVKIKSTTASPTSTLTTVITSKLIAVDKDKLVIETQRTSDATGTLVEAAPEKVDIRRWFPLLPGVKKEDFAGAPKGSLKSGEETLKLAGREVKTFWYENKGKTESGESLDRTWLSDDIPGRIVKSVINIPNAKTVITQELTEITIPKN